MGDSVPYCQYNYQLDVWPTGRTEYWYNCSKYVNAVPTGIQHPEDYGSRSSKEPQTQKLGNLGRVIVAPSYVYGSRHSAELHSFTLRFTPTPIQYTYMYRDCVGNYRD